MFVYYIYSTAYWTFDHADTAVEMKEKVDRMSLITCNKIQSPLMRQFGIVDVVSGTCTAMLSAYNCTCLKFS